MPYPGVCKAHISFSITMFKGNCLLTHKCNKLQFDIKIQALKQDQTEKRTLCPIHLLLVHKCFWIKLIKNYIPSSYEKLLVVIFYMCSAIYVKYNESFSLKCFFFCFWESMLEEHNTDFSVTSSLRTTT